VVHYDLPKSVENYSQEIGRAGRDGGQARCTVLANRDGLGVLENFVYGDAPEIEAIRGLVRMVAENPHDTWEVRLYQLCFELNIRPLPLKTLLVHLEMAGVLEPRYSYFEQLPFKFLQESEWILSRFQGERRELLRAIFEHSRTAKIWTRPDIRAVTDSYGTDKRRVLLALEYLDEKGWIELQRQRSVEVFAVLKRAFDVEEQSERLYRIMKERESYELERIRRMVGFFESETCLSSRLSAYFGQEGVEACGRCSVCISGKATLETTIGRPPLHTFDESRSGMTSSGFLLTEIQASVVFIGPWYFRIPGVASAITKTSRLWLLPCQRISKSVHGGALMTVRTKMGVVALAILLFVGTIL
jgi:ATP-dependent DNA helicase RecQ